MKISIEERQALGRVLAASRNASNLTQEKLADMSGVPLRSLQRAEKGDGISQENLNALALSLETDSRRLLASARASKAAPPGLRLQLAQIKSAAELLRLFKTRKGVFHIGPQGEHPFNEHVGPYLDTMAETLDGVPKAPKQALRESDYWLQFSLAMGFLWFTGHYTDSIPHRGKFVKQPTTLLIAAPASDLRIRNTAKGMVLDFVVDLRTQPLHRALNGGLTPYDWMEDQLISKSQGEGRVRAYLRQIHEEIRVEQDKKRRMEDRATT